MTDKTITWDKLEAKLSAGKTIQKPHTVHCPVCGIPRNKGNHQKCSKITQQKHKHKDASEKIIFENSS
ncbi:MAG: hypothetical protein QX199_07320 [Methylococcaceae bacterium]